MFTNTEDVGFKKVWTSLNFHDEPNNQNPTCLFSVLHRIKIKQYYNWIFDAAKNVYCIVSNQYTFCGSESMSDQEETEISD